jgi:predicted transposase/invertase (TIGR01784 family)
VVYECELKNGQQISITLLFEHKSYKAKNPHLQLLRYMLGVWEIEEKNEPHLKPILPIVFYHGQAKWEYRKFEEYFLNNKNGNVGFDPDLYKYLPAFEYIFINLQDRGDRWIKKQFRKAGLRISLLLMRNIRSKKLHSQIEMIFEGIEELKKTEKGREELREISIYLSHGSKRPSEKNVDIMDHATYIKLLPPVGSIGWEIEQAGIAKGISQGKAEGKAEGISQGISEAKTEFALNLLKKGFDKPMVIELTGLDSKEVEAIQKKIA